MRDKAKDFFQQKLIQPIKGQLRQGATPQGMALTVALGISIAIFPILGSTMLLCLIAGIVFKLNQPVLHAVNYIFYPLQIILIPVFLKLGATLTNSPPIIFDPVMIIQEFTEDIGLFFKKYGLAGLNGILVWLIIAPLVSWISYHILLRLFKKWKKPS
jgi:uncharacterized protein (DUF2062 family)